MNAGKVFDIVGAGKLRIDRKNFIREFNVIQNSFLSEFQKLEAYDKILETFGVERIAANETKNRHTVYYLNVGDPYVPTLSWCVAWQIRIKLAVGGYAQYVK